MMANRMCEVVPTVISENQSAFVKGRLITNNVVMANEILHYMKNKRKGK